MWGMPMRVLASRTRVDSDDARPCDRLFEFDSSTTFNDAVRTVISSDYVCADGTWRIFSHVPVAVAAKEDGALRSLIFAPSRPEELLFKDGVYKLNCLWTRNERPEDAMDYFSKSGWLPANALRKLDESGCTNSYYELCRRHPLRSADEPIEKMPGKEIAKRAQGSIGLQTERGPGTVLIVNDMPDDLRLSFVLIHRIGVSAALRGARLVGVENGELGMFRIFCRESKEQVWNNTPDRLYQDPQAYSINEMLAVFVQLRELSLSIAETLSGTDLSSFRIDVTKLDAAVRHWIPVRH